MKECPWHMFGAHLEIYHLKVFERLNAAVMNKTGTDYRKALIDELRNLRNDILNGTLLFNKRK